MKRKTYNILRLVPLSSLILELTGNAEVKFCSQMIDDLSRSGKYTKIVDFRKQHPDIVITKKVLNDIFKK